MKTDVEKRINRTIGQLEGIKRILSNDEYDCDQVITQLKAVMGSTKSLTALIAEEELNRCITQSDNDLERKQKINSLIRAAF